MSQLVHARFKDGLTPDFDKLSALTRFLFAAAQDTTSRLIAMAILVLGEKSGLQQRLRADPTRISDFLEETLRYDAPVKVAYRLAVTDTKIGEATVPAGTIVTVCLTGASNDSRHFENPQEFDIDRPKLRDHMGFSKGVHACLGAPLGRMEARIAIERILARTSDIRISQEHHGSPDARRYRFEPTYTFRSLSDLHIELSRS
jgi:cytochrome P450